MNIGLSQICSKICPKCFWEFPKNFTIMLVFYPIMPSLCLYIQRISLYHIMIRCFYYISTLQKFLYSLANQIAVDRKELFKIENTRSAAAEDGWTNRTIFAAADQHGNLVSLKIVHEASTIPSRKYPLRHQ